MSVRSDRAKPEENTTSLEAAVADTSLAEGNSYTVASSDNPLKRSLVVSIRASLNQLCLQKQKGVWSPSSDALKSVFQQKKFTSLDVRLEELNTRSQTRTSNTSLHPQPCLPHRALPTVKEISRAWSCTTCRSATSCRRSPCRSERELQASTTAPSRPRERRTR